MTTNTDYGAEPVAYLLDKETVGDKTWVKATPLFNRYGRGPQEVIEATVVEELDAPPNDGSRT